jgi:hypothetical protein
MPGCSLSNRWDRLIASVICELDTIATVIVVPELPPEKSCFAPVAQPARASVAPAADPARKVRRLSVDAGRGAAVNPASRRRVIVTSVIGLTALSVRALISVLI